MTTTGTRGRSSGAGARALLTEALAAHRGTVWEDRLRAALEQLDGPLRVAFAGRVKAGKSTLLNALVGQPLAATDATECTRVVTSYVNGPAVRAWAHPYDGPAVQVPFRRVGGQTHVDLGDLRAEDVSRLVVETPSSRLERLTLVDTPGIGSARTEVSARTEAFLVGSGAGADAVLYLMRHLHVTDVGFLRSFHDEQFDGTAPVNAIGVLSRADELAGGRQDSLQVAERIAADLRTDRRVRSLVQTVVPVCGLIGMAASLLGERHVAAVAELASGPTSLLLSADRLLDARPDLGPSREARGELLDLLGMFGVRLAVTLLRTGEVDGAVTLAPRLAAASGLEEVRRLLLDRFTARAGVLQAQNAVRVVEAVLAESGVPEVDRLRRRAEAVVAGAHELAELRLLNDLRTGVVEVDDADLLADAERLLGVDGDEPTARLGLDPSASDDEVHEAAVAALRRWQRRAGSPVASPAVRRTAETVRRTCEGLL